MNDIRLVPVRRGNRCTGAAVDGVEVACFLPGHMQVTDVVGDDGGNGRGFIAADVRQVEGLAPSVVVETRV